MARKTEVEKLRETLRTFHTENEKLRTELTAKDTANLHLNAENRRVMAENEKLREINKSLDEHFAIALARRNQDSKTLRRYLEELESLRSSSEYAFVKDGKTGNAVITEGNR
jgi:exonuclease VII large subunit